MKKKGKRLDNKKIKNANSQESEMFNFDQEIVIGITKIPEPKKKKVKKKKPKIKKEKNQKVKKDKQITEKKEPKPNKKRKKEVNKKIDLAKEKRRRRINSFLKGIAITTFCIGITLGILLSPLFKIENIETEGNKQVTAQELIILSEIQIEENIFLINNNSIINKIKNNPYIEEVKIRRKLPDKIIIEVKERNATYVLKNGEKNICINNQGYILEINQTDNKLPQILGYKTELEQLTEGARLSGEDLELLGTVLKIMETANNYGIGNLITSIDITNKNDIIVKMETER